MARRKNISKQTRIVLSELYNAPDKWWYGYELCKHLGLKSGTIYPILIRLADQEFLETEWRDSDNPRKPPRQIYRLSRAGRTLALETSKLEKATKASLFIPGVNS